VLVVCRGVDVDAADHVAAGPVEDGIREAVTSLEVPPVAYQVDQVLVERHRVRPRVWLICAEPGCRADVVDARRPGGVVALVVLGAERPEHEAVPHEPRRWNETVGDERARAGQEAAGSGGGCIAAPGIDRGAVRGTGFFSGAGAGSGSGGGTGSSGKTDASASPASSRSN